MHYMCTKFGVDSSSRFPFRSRTRRRQTDRQTDTHTHTHTHTQSHRCHSPTYPGLGYHQRG